jgi:4-amino-4-deoxy-L-arabinose transferase-like glycosyltransferase
MFQLLPVRVWIFTLWAILIAISLYFRPLFPVDETRYAAVAWEMWSTNDFLVPHLNGETYSHKPPLLFWLMTLSWRLLGVNDWSLRIISPLFSLATLFLSCRTARALWPDRSKLEELTPMILLGSFIWIVYSTLTMFDMMLAFFVLLGIHSLITLAYTGLTFSRWALLGIAIGGGLLSKGPVILLHLLPAALMAPWWLTVKKADFRWLPWVGGLVFSILVGVLIALCWAIPAGIAGGEAYRNAIFLGQTSGRLVQSFAHRLSWWWYLQMLPLFLLPWLLLKPLWTGGKKLTLRDPGIRFCLAWILPVFIAFSLISGKRIQYLLPLFPAIALVLARAADEVTERSSWERAHLIMTAVLALLGAALIFLPWLNESYRWLPDLSSISPVWGLLLCISAAILAMTKADNAPESVFYICIASIIALIIISSGFFNLKKRNYDTRDAARQISALISEKREIAYYGNKYHGQYHFTGRLKQPITVISDFKVLYNWAKDHQNAYIIVEYRKSDAMPETVFSYHYPLKGHDIGLLSAKVLLENPDLGSVLIL